MLHLRKGIILLLITTATTVAFASRFKPVVTNFIVTKQVKEAGIQNWSCTQGKNGEMYFANNKGMLIFDGYNWDMAAMPGNIVIRSVFADGDSVFAGSYEEFGYFKKDDFGNFKYHSFADKLKGVDIQHEEVWNILKIDGKIFFQTFVSAFVWDGKQLSRIYDTDHRPLYYHNINGQIYAQIINDGNYKLEKNRGGWKFQKAFDKKAFGNDEIVEALPLKNGKTILCSESNGLFLMSGSTIKPWHTEIDSDIKAGQINRAIMAGDSTIVIGTILDGIYAIGKNGESKWHYNIETGLQNNSVLRLFCDCDGNIWAALDNGISLIHTGSPYSIMIPERGELTLGMIYDLEIAGNDMFIASNQGVYKYNMLTGKIGFIDGSDGQNWHISRFGKQLFAGNNRYTLSSSDLDNFNAITNVPSSSSTCMIQCRINEQDILLESSYSTLRIYRHKNGEWQFSNNVKGFIAPIRQIEVDHSGTIWATNMTRGIYRIELSNDLTKIASSQYFKSISDSVPTNNYLMKIRGRIVISDNRRLYTYDDMHQKIIPYKELNDALTSTADIHFATPVNDRNYWLSGKYGYSLIRFENNKFNTIYYIPTEFFGLENNENSNSVYIHDNVAYFNLNNAIASLDYGTSRLRDNSKQTKALTLTHASYTSSDGETIQMPITNKNRQKANGSITLQYSYPNYDSQPVSFRFILSGQKNMTVEKQTPDIAFHDLRQGNYTVTAQTVSSEGEIIASTDYEFKIPTPFLLSVPAIIIYVIILIAGIYFFSKEQTSRALNKKRKEYEEMKKEQDIKMLEQEKLIARQQQQLLESELSAKSKELATLTLNVLAKEKTIENLKDSIYSKKRQGGITPKDMDLLLKQLESTKGDTEFWEMYQKNFDLIHEHFFRNLRERYPQLTPSDLKFCGLLRLNLSTKDIAKFTNLTVRGVETARYRLRKKLALPEKVSLIEFLIDFK